MYVIQLEKVKKDDTLKELIEYQKYNMSLLDKDMLIDILEDGDIIGMGFNNAENLENKDFKIALKEILDNIVSLGGIVDNNENITFTKEFFNNYFKHNFNTLKDYIKNLDIEDFSSLNYVEKIKAFQENDLFKDILVYSNSLRCFECDFDTLVRNRFSSLDKTTTSLEDVGTFRIIMICKGNYKY